MGPPPAATLTLPLSHSTPATLASSLSFTHARCCLVSGPLNVLLLLLINNPKAYFFPFRLTRWHLLKEACPGHPTYNCKLSIQLPSMSYFFSSAFMYLLTSYTVPRPVQMLYKYSSIPPINHQRSYYLHNIL